MNIITLLCLVWKLETNEGCTIKKCDDDDDDKKATDTLDYPLHSAFKAKSFTFFLFSLLSYFRSYTHRETNARIHSAIVLQSNSQRSGYFISHLWFIYPCIDSTQRDWLFLSHWAFAKKREVKMNKKCCLFDEPNETRSVIFGSLFCTKT